MEPKKGNIMKIQETVRQGGRNIFEDLKLPDAEEVNAKASLTGFARSWRNGN